MQGDLRVSRRATFQISAITAPSSTALEDGGCFVLADKQGDKLVFLSVAGYII